MKHKKRLSKSEITPQYEDAGLFKNEICQVKVQIVPIFEQNMRKDLVVKGFVQGNLPVTLLFAGRRTKDAAPLVELLKARRTQVFQEATRRLQVPPKLDTMRLGILVEGAWRRHFEEDEYGWGTRSYHLIAARWAVADATGKTSFFGTSPVVGDATQPSPR